MPKLKNDEDDDKDWGLSPKKRKATQTKRSKYLKHMENCNTESGEGLLESEIHTRSQGDKLCVDNVLFSSDCIFCRKSGPKYIRGNVKVFTIKFKSDAYQTVQESAEIKEN